MTYELSIVMPVYNAERYLKRILSSIGNIPDNVEIIFVNNRSTDNSLQIINDYYNAHPTSRVISEDRPGVAYARNTGLRHAIGDYIWFIDADDVIHSGAIRTILNIIHDHSFDLLVFDYQSVAPNKVGSEINTSSNIGGIVSLTALLHEMLTDEHDAIGGFPHNKVFSKALIGSSTFQDFRYAEDLAFFVPILLRSHRIYRLHQVLYDYYQNTESLVHNIDIKKMTDYSAVIDGVEKSLVHSRLVKRTDINRYMIKHRLSIYSLIIDWKQGSSLQRYIRERLDTYSLSEVFYLRKDKRLTIKFLLYKLHVLAALTYLRDTLVRKKQGDFE